MRFRVHCANPDTGEEHDWEIECATVQEAERRASDAGMLISRVEPIADAQIVEAQRQPIQAPELRQTPPPTVNVQTQPTRSNSLGIASLILGILAFLICWIPLVAIVSMPLSGLGLLLGLIGVVLALTRAGYGVGFSIAGSSVSALALVIASVMGLGMLAVTTGAINDIVNEMERSQAVSTPVTDTGDDKDTVAEDEPATTPQRPVDPVGAAPLDDRSREYLIADLKSMGNVMYLKNYVDSSGLTLTLDDYSGYIFGGVGHIHSPDSEPYEMEWRLQSGVMFDTNVPVSFLDVRYEGPFSHKVAVAAVKEFSRIAGGGVAIEDVQEAMQEAEALFVDVRARDVSEYVFRWQVESPVPETMSITNAVGDYLIKVRIQEWPAEPYIRETGGCEIFIFFAFCPPGVTEVRSIHASGF